MKLRCQWCHGRILDANDATGGGSDAMRGFLGAMVIPMLLIKMKENMEMPFSKKNMEMQVMSMKAIKGEWICIAL
jgi:hypothetical protein